MAMSNRVTNASYAACCLLVCCSVGDCLMPGRNFLPFGRPVYIGPVAASEYSAYTGFPCTISSFSTILTMVTSESSNDQGSGILNDEDLLKSVSLDMLKDIASQQGISADGSKMDILKRLRAYVNNPQNIKAFNDKDSDAMDEDWVGDIDFEDVDTDWIDDLDDTKDNM
mmetsp:Transcript_26759/g.41513  ORF Transcript_26759/g.41513 Transcript_26759/m.41513 type:complete len:169 (+) Transcript_26759:59-565(+)